MTAPNSPPPHNPQTSTRTRPTEGLAKVFNSALVSTFASDPSLDFTVELFAIAQSPAYRAILKCVETLAAEESISEREAAESVARTFRKLDQLWSGYLRNEGLERLRKN